MIALQTFHVLSGLLQERLHIGRHRSLALAAAQRTGGKPRDAGQPLLQLIEKPVLRLSRGQIEKAQYQRAGQAEHG